MLKGGSLDELNLICESVESALKSFRNYSPAPSERQQHSRLLSQYSSSFESIVKRLEKDAAMSPGLQELKFDELEDHNYKEKHAHTLKIQEKMALAGELMKDCAALVNEQGMDLDRIDTHVDSAKKYTAKGNVELEKTDLRQRRKKCFCWSLLVVAAGFLVAMIIVIVLLTKKK